MSTPNTPEVDNLDRIKADAKTSLDRLAASSGPLYFSLMIGAMAALMFAAHRSGHWWGDDWALYIRQANGLLDGNPGRVFTENLFAVERSRGADFSPPLYPWGFPLLLAPFIAVLGADVDRLAIVPVLCACVFACAWFTLARRRIGPVAAAVGVLAVTLTPLLFSWTELIQSEWPFLAVTAVALVVIDNAARSDMFVNSQARYAPLLIVGFVAAAAFTVRREGLAMFAAIAAAQLAALIAGGSAPWRGNYRRVTELFSRLAIPHLAGILTVVSIQVVLPSTIVPSYEGTGISNMWRLAHRHIHNLAMVAGFERPGIKHPSLLGNTALGWAAVWLYIVAALVGISLAFGVHRRRDLHLVAYTLAAFAIGTSFRSANNRYVCTVGPLLMLFALVAITRVLRRFTNKRIGPVVVALLAYSIAASNFVNIYKQIEGANKANEAGYIEWGATHPDAIAMFEAVRNLTDPGDIVAAPKARAMTLETGLLAVQVDEYRRLPTDLDLAVVVVEPDTDLSLFMQSQPLDYTIAWENSRFIIFVPNR